ncbi:MAG: bifunctional diaminohydroxyphosphoribosylaminopyrimidine deaminase/5-amino-6-(5-phosphoribosylamino)uracil reductase RibD [Pseudomonadota bacterium]
MPTSPPSEQQQNLQDRHFMAVALRLAERGLGRVWPNPAVGCVLVLDGRIVGRGWTQPGGRPHAEVEALRRAGEAALGATAYVSLEPCAHYGRTPPCTMALLQAGVRRVVVATLDPDARVDGRGVEQLRQAGVEVSLGVGRAEAEAINAGFFLRVRAGRPLVTLKVATSLDGMIATRAGESQWITGDLARARGHLLRARHDAIMIGSGTALADDPSLTCRLTGLEDRSPVRVVLDRQVRLSPDSKLATSASNVPTWLFTGQSATPSALAGLHERGIDTVAVGLDSMGRLDIAEVLSALAERGITRVLVEGGASLAASFLRARLVDRLAWFRAPKLIGGDGRPAVGELGIDAISDALVAEMLDSKPLAQDRAERYIFRVG